MAIVEVVKYNGSPDVFAWKYPSEELGNQETKVRQISCESHSH